MPRKSKGARGLAPREVITAKPPPWWLASFLAELRRSGKRELAADLAGISLPWVARCEERDREIAAATAAARAHWLAGEKRRRRAAARRARAGFARAS